MSCHHRGPYVQRGRGFGSTLGSMFKGIVPAMKLWGQRVYDSPHTKSILETAKNSALEAGLNVAQDTLSGKNVKESVRGNVTAAKRKVSDSLASAFKRVKRQHFDAPPAAPAAAAVKTPARRRAKAASATATAAAAGLLHAKKAYKRARRTKDIFDV